MASDPDTIPANRVAADAQAVNIDYRDWLVAAATFPTGVRNTHQRFREIWNSIFLPPTLVPESLVEAPRKNHMLLLLSHRNAIHHRFLVQRYRHIGFFHHHILSQESGAQKPAREIR